MRWRSDDAANAQQHEHRQADGDDGLRGVVARPQQHHGGDRAGQAGRNRQQQNAPVVAEFHWISLGFQIACRFMTIRHSSCGNAHGSMP